MKLKEATIKLVDIKTKTPKGKGRGKTTKRSKDMTEHHKNPGPFQDYQNLPK